MIQGVRTDILRCRAYTKALTRPVKRLSELPAREYVVEDETEMKTTITVGYWAVDPDPVGATAPVANVVGVWRPPSGVGPIAAGFRRARRRRPSLTVCHGAGPIVQSHRSECMFGRCFCRRGLEFDEDDMGRRIADVLTRV